MPSSPTVEPSAPLLNPGMVHTPASPPSVWPPAAKGHGHNGDDDGGDGGVRKPASFRVHLVNGFRLGIVASSILGIVLTSVNGYIHAWSVAMIVIACLGLFWNTMICAAWLLKLHPKGKVPGFILQIGWFRVSCGDLDDEDDDGDGGRAKRAEPRLWMLDAILAALVFWMVLAHTMQVSSDMGYYYNSRFARTLFAGATFMWMACSFYVLVAVLQHFRLCREATLTVSPREDEEGGSNYQIRLPRDTPGQSSAGPGKNVSIVA